MFIQYIPMVNLGCHIGYAGFVGKTCENIEAEKWNECKGDESESTLCRLHVCSVQCRW